MARSDWKRPAQFPLPDGMRRIRVTVSYDGSMYSGWQRQRGVRTVQEEIEKALHKMLKECPRVFGSGRTDAGVHAVGQVAHFDITNQSVPPEVFSLALNQLLPQDVRLRDSCGVSGTFHARFTSVSREYRYLVKQDKDVTPFDRSRVGKVRAFPSLDLLNEYARTFIGTHDYSTYSASADQSSCRIRDLYESRFWLEDAPWGGSQLVYQVSGNAFLMHQVRSMVGTMLQAALAGESVSLFKWRLDSRDRSLAGRTAAPDGLYLYRIDYDD